MKIEMETQTMEKFAKQMADEALKRLEINDTPLEDFIIQVDKLVRFLNKEIEISKEKLHDKMDCCNPFYDGEYIGNYKVARKLTEKHIKLCERMLKMLTDKNAN